MYDGLGDEDVARFEAREEESVMKLSIRIVKNDSGGYTALCSSLPGCVTRAGSEKEAYAKMQDAVRGYIAAVGNCTPTCELRLLDN